MSTTPSDAGPAWVSVKRAAELTGLSSRTIRRYVFAGLLDAGNTPGGHLRVPRAQVVDLIRPVTSNQEDAAA